MSARASCSVTPSFIRAYTFRKWLVRDGGRGVVENASGAQSSIVSSGNSKDAGSTPTISCGTALSRIFLPTTELSLPNRSFQILCPRITTRCCPTIASSARNVRPRLGVIPRTSKNGGDTAPANSRTGSPAPVRSAVTTVMPAIAENDRCIVDQSRKSAGETTLSRTPSVCRFSHTMTRRSESA